MTEGFSAREPRSFERSNGVKFWFGGSALSFENCVAPFETLSRRNEFFGAAPRLTAFELSGVNSVRSADLTPRQYDRTD